MELNAYKYRLRNEMAGNPFVGMIVDSYKDKLKNKSLEELEAEMMYRLNNQPRQCGKTRTNMLMDMELMDIIMQKRKERLLSKIRESEGKYLYEKNINSIINAVPNAGTIGRNFKFKK